MTYTIFIFGMTAYVDVSYSDDAREVVDLRFPNCSDYVYLPDLTAQEWDLLELKIDAAEEAEAEDKAVTRAELKGKL